MKENLLYLLANEEKQEMATLNNGNFKKRQNQPLMLCYNVQNHISATILANPLYREFDKAKFSS